MQATTMEDRAQLRRSDIRTYDHEENDFHNTYEFHGGMYEMAIAAEEDFNQAIFAILGKP